MRVPYMAGLSVVAFAGCDAATPTTGPSPHAPHAAVVQQTLMPLALNFGNACVVPVDVFLVTGAVHVVRTLTRDEAGGVHQTVHVNFQSASGTSLTTRIQYRVISTQAISVNNAGPLPFERTVQVIVKLVGSGPDANRTLRTQMHVTVNGNGEVTISFSDNEVICQ